MTVGSEIAKLYASVGADVSDYKKGLGFVKSSLGDLSGQMGGVLKVVGGLGVALAGAFASKEIISGAMDLNKSLTNIQSLGGRTADEMKKLQETLIGVGSNTILQGGAQSAANAFYDIASGVQGADKQMAIFDAAIATAEAGQASLTATSAGLVSVMNSYGLGAKDATNVSDIFTRTVGLGVGTMDQFVAALSPIANLAATAGVSFEELGTSAAFLTSKGATTGDAATELQSALVALLKPTDTMEAALTGLGYSAEGLIKEFGLVGAIEKLKGTTDGSASSLTNLFGRVEALKGVLAVTGKDFNKFADTFKDGLKGATKAAREIQRNSPEAKIAKFGNQLNALGLKIGSALLPPLGDLVEGLGKLLDGLDAVTKPVKDFIGAIASPLIEKGKKAFGAFTDQFGDFVKNVKDKGLRKAIESALNLGDGKKYLSGWIQGVLEALGMDKGAAGQIVTVVKNALIGALDIFDSFKQGIQYFISDIQQFGLADAILGAFGLGKSGAAAGSQSWIEGIFNTIKDVAGRFMPQISQMVSDLVSGIGNFITENAPKVNAAFQDVLGKVGDWLGSDGPGELVKGLANLIGAAADWIVKTGWPMFRDGFIKVVDGIKTFIQGPGVQKFLNGLGTMFGNVVNWIIQTGIPTFTDGLIGIGQGIYDFFTHGGWDNFKKSLVEVFTKVYNWITTDGVKFMVNAINDMAIAVAKSPGLLTLANAIPGLGTLANNFAVMQPQGVPKQELPKQPKSTPSRPKPLVSGRTSKITPFAGGGLARPGTSFVAGEGGVPEIGRVTAQGTYFKPMTSGASGGSSGGNHYTIVVTDRDLEARIDDILARNG